MEIQKTNKSGNITDEEFFKEDQTPGAESQDDPVEASGIPHCPLGEGEQEKHQAQIQNEIRASSSPLVFTKLKRQQTLMKASKSNSAILPLHLDLKARASALKIP